MISEYYFNYPDRPSTLKLLLKVKGSGPANPERVGPVKQIYLRYCMDVLPRLHVFSLQEGSAL